MMLKKRVTTATRARLGKIKKLMLALADGPLERDEIMYLLSLSPTGAREYVKDLLAENVIRLLRYVGANPAWIGMPLYGLSPDVQRVAEFMLMLDVDATDAAPDPLPRQVHQNLVPGRHLHIMGDDVHYTVKLSGAPPPRDELMLAFFGPAKAQEARP